MKLRRFFLPMVFMIFMLLVFAKADTSAQTVSGIFYWYGSSSGYTDNNYYQWHSWYSSPANPTQVYNSNSQIIDSVSNGWTITSISWYTGVFYSSSRGQYERGVSVSYYKPDVASLSYINLSPSSMTINGTNSTGGRFTVYAHYSNGTSQDVTTQTYWSTNNTSVAWVADRSNGTAYSRGSTGMATITAMYPYGQSNQRSTSATVTVTSAPSGGGGGGAPVLSLSASPTSIYSGGSSTLTLTSNINVGPTAYSLRIYDQTSGTFVASTGTGTSLTYTATLTSSHTYIGQATGGTPSSSSNSVTITVGSSGGGGGGGSGSTTVNGLYIATTANNVNQYSNIYTAPSGQVVTSVAFTGNSESNYDYGYLYYYLNGTWTQAARKTGSNYSQTITMPAGVTQLRTQLTTDGSVLYSPTFVNAVPTTSSTGSTTVNGLYIATTLNNVNQYSNIYTAPSGQVVTSVAFTGNSESNYDYGYLYYYLNGTWTQAARKTGSNYSQTITMPAGVTQLRTQLTTDGSVLYSPTFVNAVPTTGSTLIAPTNLRATGTASNTISVSWNPVSGASGYILYEQDSTGTYQVMGSILGGSYTTMSISSFSPATTYSFKVAAYITFTNPGPQSAAASGTTYPSTPGGLYINNATTNSLQAHWNAVSGIVTGYKIYRSASATGTYTYINSTTNTYYTDSGLTVGTTYFYEVTAYNSSGESAKSSYASGTTLVIIPTITSVTLSGPRTYGQDVSVSATGTNATQASYKIFYTTSITAPPVDYTVNAAVPGPVSAWADSNITGTLTANSSTNVSGIVAGANLNNTTWTYITLKVAIGSATNNWVWLYSQAYSLSAGTANTPDSYIGYVGHNQIITVNGNTQVILTDPNTPDPNYGPYSSSIVNNIGTYNTFVDGDYVKYRLEFDVTNSSQINDIGVNLYFAGGTDIHLSSMELEKQQSNGSYAAIKPLTGLYVRQGVGRYTVLLGKDNSGTPIIQAPENGAGRYAIEYEGIISVAPFIGRITTTAQNLSTIAVYSSATSYPYILQMQKPGRKFYINTNVSGAVVQYQ